MTSLTWRKPGIMILVVSLPLIRPSRVAMPDEDTETPRVKLGPWAAGLNVGPGMNAVGKNLKGSEFVGQDLQGAVFAGCDLDGVLFYQCNLTSASFKRARLSGMNITDCRIEGADFADAVINGVVGMSGGLADPPFAVWPHDMRLSDEQFLATRSYKVKDLSRCVISLSGRRSPAAPKWDFRGANLQGALLHHGDFTGCDFTDARIDGIELSVCTVAFEQFASTDNFKNRRALRGARFRTVRLLGEWSFRGMDLSGTVFEGVDSAKFDFTDADIANCAFGSGIGNPHLRSTRNFKEGDLSHMRFYAFDLSGFDFSGVNLTRSEFSRGCDFTGANFEDAVLTGVRFGQGVTGLTVEQIQSTWNYKHGRMAGIVLPKKKRADPPGPGSPRAQERRGRVGRAPPDA